MTGLGQVGALGRLGAPALARGGWWLSESQLDLDFANNRAFNRSTGFNGSPNGILTYTSPSPKMVYGNDGVLRYAPHNLLTYSEQFDNAAWTKTNTSVSTGQVSPAGDLTAYKLVASVSASANHAIAQSVSVLRSQVRFQIRARAAEKSWLAFGDAISGVAYFDLANGVLGTVTSATASITSLGDGWYLCSVETSIGAAAPVPTWYVANSNGVVSFVGDGVSGLYVWHAEVCRAPVHDSPYIPTTSAAVYALPIDHDPITFEPLGVLIEEQRTNLLLRSQEFGATWNVGSNSVTADQDTAPDDTVTADLVTMVINSGVFQTVSVSQSTSYTLSFWVKRGTKTELRYRVYDNIGAANITAPTSYYSSTSSGGFSRVTHTFTTPVGCTSLRVYLDDSNDGSSGTFFAWGAQLEAGAFATSYIQTGSAQVTRASDNIKLLTSAFNFSGATSTILAESDVDNLIGTHHVFSLHDGSNNERCVLRSIDAAMNYAISDGGVLQASNNVPGTVQARQMQSVAFAFAVNDIALSMDGGSITSDTSATLPTVTTLSLGASYYTGLDQLNGHIKRLTYWNIRKTDAELQALSA